jgi:hypothetical protein
LKQFGQTNRYSCLGNVLGELEENRDGSRDGDAVQKKKNMTEMIKRTLSFKYIQGADGLSDTAGYKKFWWCGESVILMCGQMFPLHSLVTAR